MQNSKPKKRIKRITKNVDNRIYDVLTQLYGSCKAEKKYKYIMLKTEINTINAF